jgi:outer membrane protein OmpA-like peptidoglycan-associated protein
MGKKFTLVIILLALVLGLATTLSGQNKMEESPVISLSAGSLLVQKPEEYGGTWSGFYILDENPKVGWASPKGKLTNHIFVIALAEKTQLQRLEFDTAQVDGDGRGAKDVTVELSDQSATEGFKPIARVTLQDRANRQSFPVSGEAAGRWLRLTVLSNHGATDYTELMDFRGYGKQLSKTPFPEVSGTYDTNYGKFHVLQQGASLSGCYEHDEGLLSGGIESRIMKITWRQKERSGPAIMVFSPDVKQFFGLWWNEGKTSDAGGVWNGKFLSKEVGGCPNWKSSGGVQQEMSDELARFGRVRVYGINFDTDSSVIRNESKTTLEKIVALLKAEPNLKLTIEGHTDATGTAAHNQDLSQRRAESVKAYLVAGGAADARIKTAGYGATKPVAGNDSDMGRAQNRRVELVKN